MLLRQFLTAAVASTALTSCASAPPVSSVPQPVSDQSASVDPTMKLWTGTLNPTQSYNATAVASKRQNAYGRVELTVSPSSPTLTHVTLSVSDGDLVEPGAVLAEIEGPAITVLAVERTALNLVQRLTGIATMTRAYVDALKGTKAVLLDTRKTTPSLRAFERYAVRCGGGTNHRPGLSGGFLVKDNHADGAGSTWEATRRAGDFRALNRRLHGLLLEAEARTLDEVHQALDAGAERVLLDNMTTAAIRKAVEDVHLFNEATGQDVTTEASGRMTPETARDAAEAGVDFVSAGALTHSARAIDIALDVVASRPQPRLKPRAARKPLTRLLRIPKNKIPNPKGRT